MSAMSWLKPSDMATVELAKTYARQIDTALQGSPDDAARALFLGPHLLNTLRALGGAPAERKALKIEETARGKLGQLRDKAKERGLSVIDGGAAG